MHKRALTTLMSLVGLAALALLWIGFDAEDASVPRAKPVEAGNRAPGIFEVSVPVNEGSNPGRAPAGSEEGRRRELPGVSGPGPILRVVEAATGQPVPGAEVRLVEYRAARQRARVERRPVQSQYEFLPLYGRRRISDDRGEVRLPFFEGRLLVSAAAGDLYGVAKLEGELPERVDLLLVPDHALTLSVLDASGEPVAFVPLGIRSRVAKRRRILWSGLSGESGSIQIEHLQIFLPDWARRAELQVDLLFPQRDPLGLPFALAAAPSQELTVAMPPTGSVEITLLHRDQAKVMSAALATCQLIGPRVRRGEVILPRQSRVSSSKRQGSDPILIPFLGLGLQLSAEAKAKPLKFGKRKFAGPRFQGEKVQLNLEAEPTVATLVGRVVDAKGGVLSERQLEMGFITAQIVGRRTRVRSDAKGRFEFSSILGRRRPDALFCELRANPQEPGSSTQVEVPAMEKGGRFDLGDVVLRTPEVYAQARVIDDLGSPVEDMRAWVQKPAPPSKAGSPRAWLVDPEMSVVHVPGGGLLIRGMGQGARRLRIASPTHLPIEPVRLFSGKDFEIVLTRGAALAGSLRIDPWVASAAIGVRVQASAEAGAGVQRPIRGRGEVRTFGYKALQQGTLGLQVFLKSERQEIFRLADLKARVGQQLQDPRLLEIDLRGRLNRVGIRLRNAYGLRPRRKGALALVEPLRPGQRRQFYDLSKGSVDIATLRSSLDLTLLVPGFEPKALSGAAGVMQVELRRATAQRIELQGAGLPLSAPFSMRIVLLPDPPLIWVGKIADAYTGRGQRLNPRPYALQPAGKINRLGRCQFLHLNAGRYHVRLSVSKRGDPKPRRIELPSPVQIAPGFRPLLVVMVPDELLPAALGSFE